jgi:hypothetical protein
MRWIGLVLYLLCLVGCLRARATVVHPTGLERTTSGGGETIARGASVPEMETPDANANIGSIEVGAMFPFRNGHSTTRVHIAPGIRIFSSNRETVLAGVAIGADFANRFALEGSVYVGDGYSDPEVIDQAVDIFAGMTMSARSTTIAVGPSLGMLMMPGGNSAVMLGVGLRVTTARE